MVFSFNNDTAKKAQNPDKSSFFADWLVFILNWLVFIEFLVVFLIFVARTLKLILYETEALYSS